MFLCKKNPPIFTAKNLASRFSNLEKPEFLIKKNSSDSEKTEELCDANTIDQFSNQKTKLQSSVSDCDFERRSDGAGERWLFDAKHKKAVAN